MYITNNLHDKIDILVNLVTDMTKLTQHMLNQQLHSSQVPIYVTSSSMTLLTDFSGDEDEFVARNRLSAESIITMNNWHSGPKYNITQLLQEGVA
jgi:hypothetical protein